MSVQAAGSTHDSTALGLSPLGRVIDEGKFPAGYFVVGDDAYKSSEALLTPWPGKKLSMDKDGYNFWQSHCRIEIECAFGMLVRKWLLLGRGVDANLERAQVGFCTAAQDTEQPPPKK